LILTIEGIGKTKPRARLRFRHSVSFLTMMKRERTTCAPITTAAIWRPT
jgi:hypothetical protein